MQYSTNYNLKKPAYTDFADIQDINDNMDTIDAQLAAPTGDSADSTTTFTTSDTADGGASSWTTVPALTSGETHKSLFAKMSQMFKNIRYLYKLLGTTNIASIGNGTVTGGLSSLNDSLSNHNIQYKAYRRAESAVSDCDLAPIGVSYSNADTLHRPGDYCLLVTWNLNNTYGIQVAFVITADKAYMRRYNNAGWASWVTLH